MWVCCVCDQAYPGSLVDDNDGGGFFHAGGSEVYPSEGEDLVIPPQSLPHHLGRPPGQHGPQTHHQGSHGPHTLVFDDYDYGPGYRPITEGGRHGYVVGRG